MLFYGLMNGFWARIASLTLLAGVMGSPVYAAGTMRDMTSSQIVQDM